MIIRICHLCQCQEMFRGTLTFIYDKIVSIFTIFVSKIYVKVKYNMSRFLANANVIGALAIC